MRLYKSEATGLPIFNNEHQQVGILANLGIELQTGKLLSLWTASGVKYQATDIISWDQITISDSAEPLSSQRMTLANQRVYSVNGKRLGKLSDYQIDTNQLMLTQIVVKSGWLRKKTRMFPYSQIESISKDQIVLQEDEATVLQDKQALSMASSA